MPELENHSQAWSRMYQFRKRFPKRRWQYDEHCPIRMRGYTELVFGNLPPKLRKKIDSAVKRGYTLEESTQLPTIIRLIEEFNPICKPFAIGYMGKTEMSVYVPKLEQAEELRQVLKAVVVMTDKIKMQDINVGTIDKGMWPVTCSVAHVLGEDPASTTAHLKPCFTGMRGAIGEFLNCWAKEREAVAKWCADDACTIRIPFDSHKDRNNES